MDALGKPAPSFRGASEAREPGIQRHLRRRRLDSGFRPSAGPGIARIHPGLESACVDPEKLAEALELLKIAKVAARTRRGRWRPLVEPTRPIMQLVEAAWTCTARRGRRLTTSSLTANRRPRSRRRASRRDEHHVWMLEKE
jgi:hypothetical protein